MKKKAKVYEVCGKGRVYNNYFTTLYFRTYNKKLAINYAQKHSDSYDIIELGTYYYIEMFGGDKGY